MKKKKTNSISIGWKNWLVVFEWNRTKEKLKTIFLLNGKKDFLKIKIAWKREKTNSISSKWEKGFFFIKMKWKIKKN